MLNYMFLDVKICIFMDRLLVEHCRSFREHLGRKNVFCNLFSYTSSMENQMEIRLLQFPLHGLMQRKKKKKKRRLFLDKDVAWKTQKEGKGPGVSNPAYDS